MNDEIPDGLDHDSGQYHSWSTGTVKNDLLNPRVTIDLRLRTHRVAGTMIKAFPMGFALIDRPMPPVFFMTKKNTAVRK